MKPWVEIARIAWCRRTFGDHFEIAFGAARPDDVNESRVFYGPDAQTKADADVRADR